MLVVDLISARLRPRQTQETSTQNMPNQPRRGVSLVPGAEDILRTMSQEAQEQYQYVFGMTQVEHNLLNNPYFRRRSMVQY